MLVLPLFRNMSMHFPLLLRERVVTATAWQDYREGIVPSRSGQLSKFTFTCDDGRPAANGVRVGASAVLLGLRRGGFRHQRRSALSYRLGKRRRSRRHLR